MSTDPRARAWLELSGDALLANYRAVRAAVGSEPAIIPAVKADGYGLGMLEVCRILEGEGPGAYAVATVAEGHELRASGIMRPIHLIGPVAPGSEEAALSADLTLTVSSTETLDRLRRAAERLGRPGLFQVEVDTGMGRAGFPDSDVARWAPLVAAAAAPPLRWVGIYTHFHSAEDPDGTSVGRQRARFGATLEALPGIPKGVTRHLSNSAAALRFGGMGDGAVRPGIFLYGGRVAEDLPAPQPVAALKARVIHVREAEPGSSVGYGATHVAAERERWATLGVGYGDGLPRAFGPGGSVLLRGVRAPIIGRISMDMTVVDISNVPGVEVGQVATVLGSDPDGAGAITLEEIAERSGTISYEVLTGFTRRLPRLWRVGETGRPGGGPSEGPRAPIPLT